MRVHGANTWRRSAVVLSRASFAVVGASVVAQLLIAVFTGAPIRAIVPPLLIALGLGAGIRRRYGGLVLVVAAVLIAAPLGLNTILPGATAVVFAFHLTLRGAPWPVTGVCVAVANLVVNGGYGLSTQIVAITSTAFFAAAAGSLVRVQGAYWDELERRARAAIESRATAVAQAITEERLRIARDLHDSVGHRIAVVGMQLGLAEVAAPDSRQHAAAIAAARASVQSVLDETQQILRVLRTDETTDEWTPSAAVQFLPDLVERFRGAGVDLDAELPATELDLDPAVSAATYRIVQESLTNAQRHGTGAATLVVDVGPDTILITTRNRVGAVSPGRPGGGNGVIGMKERAQSVGGTLTTAVTGDVHTLRAALPIEGARP